MKKKRKYIKPQIKKELQIFDVVSQGTLTPTSLQEARERFQQLLRRLPLLPRFFR